MRIAIAQTQQTRLLINISIRMEVADILPTSQYDNGYCMLRTQIANGAVFLAVEQRLQGHNNENRFEKTVAIDHRWPS